MKKRNGFVYTHKAKNIISITVLIIGALVISALIALIQINSSKDNQKRNSINSLNEVVLTLEENDEIIRNVTNEYNCLNQNTIQSLASYAQNAHLFSASMNADEVTAACKTFADLKDDLNTGDMSVASSDGHIIISSDPRELNTNIPSDKCELLFKYDLSKGINGTEQYENGVYSYTPVLFSEESGTNFYKYSIWLAKESGVDYYLLLDIDSNLLEEELNGIDKIGNVLKNLTIGNDGFFFAINTETGKFEFFDYDDMQYTGMDYSELGFSKDAAIDGYNGFQRIKDKNYYCVTKSSESQTYGKYIIVAAAINQEALIAKNVMTILISCITFILAACVISSYGMILDRDVANHYIDIEDKTRKRIKDEKAVSNVSYTSEEIDERTEIQMQETVLKGDDKKLARVNIGFRNKKGKQAYFSPFIAKKISPLIFLGLLVIFGFVYFSQTLLMVQDGTNVAVAKLDQVGTLIEENNDSASKISEFISEQYLSKDKLIGYILSNDALNEEDKQVFTYDVNDKDTFAILDENGDELTDAFGNVRYSKRYSAPLMETCENNGISAVYVFDYEGHCMLTSTYDWFFTLGESKEQQSYMFREIVNGHRDTYIQELMVDDNGNLNQYIGSAFTYYTTLDSNGNTVHTTENDYDQYLEAKKTNPQARRVIKNRGCVQVAIDHTTLENMYKISSLEYILKDASVYGENSFFVAFDDSETHNVVFAPSGLKYNINGKTAADLGLDSTAFRFDQNYNEFISVEGTSYYLCVKYVDGYYLASVILSSDLYFNRLYVTLYTALLSFVFIVVGSSFFTTSDDSLDASYRADIKENNRALSRPVNYYYKQRNGKKVKISASSRFIKTAWNKKVAEQKLSTILTAYLTFASFLILIIILYAMTARDSSSIFTYIFGDSWEKGFNIFAFTKAFMIIIMIISVAKIAKFFVQIISTSLGARAETTGNLIVSIIKYGGVLGALFYALYLFGFNTGSLITSAGILSVVVGLGAQSLIGDILAGMFIVFEGEFRVGDIVTIGDFRGQVIEIGLRTTKLIDISNNIKVYNNSTISSVLNMSKDSSFALCDIGIEYGEDLERVEKVLLEGFRTVKNSIPEIIDGPFYKGVQELGDSAVTLRIIATCEEKDRIQVARDLNREIFLLFKKNDINVPFNQVTLSYLDEEGGNK